VFIRVHSWLKCLLDQCSSAQISGEKDFDLLRAFVVDFGFGCGSATLCFSVTFAVNTSSTARIEIFKTTFVKN